MHLALIKYSVLRLALFVASLIVLYAVGVRRSLLMVVLAAAISLALSYLLLRGPRNELALALSDRVSARTQRRRPGIGQADAEEEDAAVAAAQARSDQPRSGQARSGQPRADQPHSDQPSSDRETDRQQ